MEKKGATRDRKAAKERYLEETLKGHPCTTETNNIQAATVKIKIQEAFEMDFVCHFNTCGVWRCIGGPWALRSEPGTRDSMAEKRRLTCFGVYENVQNPGGVEMDQRFGTEARPTSQARATSEDEEVREER